jgi:hypothetical protein
MKLAYRIVCSTLNAVGTILALIALIQKTYTLTTPALIFLYAALCAFVAAFSVCLFTTLINRAIKRISVYINHLRVRKVPVPKPFISYIVSMKDHNDILLVLNKRARRLTFRLNYLYVLLGVLTVTGFVFNVLGFTRIVW